MQFVEDEVLEREAVPFRVMPFELCVDDFRCAVHPFRLKSRRGIGTLDAVEHVVVTRACVRIYSRGVIAAAVLLHRNRPLERSDDAELDTVAAGRPHAELDAPRRDHTRAEAIRVH